MKYLKEYNEYKNFNIGDYIMFEDTLDFEENFKLRGSNAILRCDLIFKIVDVLKYDTANVRNIFDETAWKFKIDLRDPRIKKISKEEALITIDANKYNL